MTGIVEELAELEREYGPTFHLDVACNDRAFWHRRAPRVCEVCMVIRRPDGRIITFTKTFYPAGIFRLMTGGVEEGERVLDALRREVVEETGLEVGVERLLAVIGYRAEDDPEGMIRFHTVAFLLREESGALGAIDPDESVGAFDAVEPAELAVLAGRLEALPDMESDALGENWRDWGHFRAVVHRTVAGILTQS